MLRVYSTDFVYLYGITKFQNLQAVKKYVGESVMLLKTSLEDDAVHYLQEDGYILHDDGEPFIIKNIKQGLEEIEVTAYGIHRLLKQRITGSGLKKTGTISRTGSADEVVKYFIDQCKGDLPIITANVQGGVAVSDQTRLKNLGDEVERILTGSGRGEIFTFDPDNKRIIFDTYLGADRSRGNPFDNPPVVFDIKYKNIDEYTYTEDATVKQTTAYVGGQGEGEEREIIITGDDVTGVARVEVFVDARDVEIGDVAKLTERGAQATIPTARTVSAGAVADANLVYGIDYHLGDIVTTNVPAKSYQKNGDYFDPIETVAQVNQRITEVVITREGSEEHIDLRFGDQPISKTEVQRLNAEVAQLKAVEGVSGTNMLSLPRIRVTAADDASLLSTEHGFQVGPKNGANIIIDPDEIMARNNGSASGLYLNHNGGSVYINGQAAWHAGNLAVEDGTFTPVCGGGTSDGSMTYTTQYGRYSRIGNRVKIWVRIVINSITTAPGGALRIKTLPYSATGIAAVGAAYTAGVSWGTGKTQAVAYVPLGANYVNIAGLVGNGSVEWVAGSYLANDDDILLEVEYYIG